MEGAAEHGDRLASALCSGGNSGTAGPSAIGQTAAIYTGVPQASADHATEPPPKRQAVWDGPALAEQLKTVMGCGGVGIYAPTPVVGTHVA